MAFNPGGGGGLSGATDVALSNPATNQLLSFDGTAAKWKNQTSTKVDVSDKAVANGVATLNGSVKIPNAQLANPIMLVADGAAIPAVTNGAILHVYDPTGTL